jgi:hypothetical protein
LEDSQAERLAFRQRVSGKIQIATVAGMSPRMEQQARQHGQQQAGAKRIFIASVKVTGNATAVKFRWRFTVHSARLHPGIAGALFRQPQEDQSA